MKTIRDQVIEFHRAVEQPILPRPTVPGDDRVRLRAALVIEEALEFVEALFDRDATFYHESDGTDYGVKASLQVHKAALKNLIASAPVKVDMPAAVDALADIDYVVAGSYLEFGVDSRPIAAEVHRANMAKASGPVAANGKRLKPEGWTPPDIAGCLAAQASPAPREEHRIGDVLIEHIDQPTGWAVFTGCEGEDPSFHAYFATLEGAELFLKACRNPDSDTYLCDPTIVPAALVDGEIVIANHCIDVEGAEAVVKAAGLGELEGQVLVDEAKAAKAAWDRELEERKRKLAEERSRP